MYQLAVEMFSEGKSLRSIEKETGINRKTLSKRFKEDGLVIKARSKGTTGKRKYLLNESSFKTIDSEEKAYWLGFLYADGYINTSFGHIEVALGGKDETHLEEFKAFLETDAPIKHRLINGHDTIRFTVCSRKMTEDLIRHGCTPAKSLTLTFPEHLPKELERHFMRGYFDGDGSVHVRKDGQVLWEVIGTKEFLDAYSYRLGLSNTKYNRHGEAYGLRYSGNNNARDILSFLYDDANIYLKRKYDKIAHVKPCELLESPNG